MPPGDALAIVIKELQDEIVHIEVQIQEQNQYYFGLDKAIGQRERRRALMTVQKLQREYESKSAQVYKLHDVLEGQKQAGQLMTQEELDVTIASICGPLEVTATQTQETAKSSVRGSTVSEFKGFD
jgi:1-deoxy-D-xylulose 5-phosphate reductoisomerase